MIEIGSIFKGKSGHKIFRETSISQKNHGPTLMNTTGLLLLRGRPFLRHLALGHARICFAIKNIHQHLQYFST